MNLLVLAPRAVDAAAVRAALPDDDLDGARVLVVAPAANQSAVAFWMSDADEAIADAEDAAAQTVRALEARGASAHGTAGEAEPMTALQDALATFPADRIVVFGKDDAEAAEIARQASERFDVDVVTGRLGAG
jgi:hypothetical protein